MDINVTKSILRRNIKIQTNRTYECLFFNAIFIYNIEYNIEKLVETLYLDLSIQFILLLMRCDQQP